MSVAAMRRLTACLAVFLLVFSCATPPLVPPPEWSRRPPADTATHLRFVGSGATRREAAEEIADAVAGRLSLGSAAKLDSEPVRRFQDALVSDALDEASADLPGFRVTGHAVSRDEEQNTHWLLAAYEREAFRTAELDLAREVPGGNRGPYYLEQAERHLADDRLVEALRHYGRAVVETAGTVYARDTLDQAARAVAELLERIKVDVERDGVETRIGRPYETSLAISVRDTLTDTGVAGMPVVVTYPEYTEAGGFETQRLYRRSGQDGLVTFTPPEPRVRGESSVTMSLAPFFDLTTPTNRPEELGRLARLAGSRSAVLNYRAISLASQIPTGVYVVDTDIAGNPTGGMATQRGLLVGFDDRGFAVSPLPFDPQRFLSLAEPDRVSMMRQRFDDEYERVVFGTASISAFEEEDSIAVEVQGEIRAIETESGDELYRNRMVQRSRGNTASSAIAAAFRGLGAKFASDLANRLP